MSNVSEQVSKAAESARETVAKVGESVSDFFQGNPFATPVGRKIELATDANLLATENWGLNMEICDFINGTEEGPRDAVRAIKKRLHNAMSKNNAVVMYTLTVLETAVKNCNHRFHVLVCNKEFVQDLIKLIGPKFDAPQIIQERVLSLIQAWADAFREDPTLAGVVQSYDDLKSKGVEFPAADLDTLAPIKTPKRTVFNQPPAPLEQPQQQQQLPQQQQRSYAQAVNPDPTYDGLVFRELGLEPIAPTPEQLTTLRADLDVVNQNIQVFRESLTDVVPGKETAEELQLLSDLHHTCRQMQVRIMDLIQNVRSEDVTYELIMVNDSLNSVFEKYDRFVLNRNGEKQAAEARDLIDMGDGKSLGDQLSALKVTAASGGPSTATTSQDAYKASAEPRTDVGLATAVSNKLPSENEAAEMEKWLETQSEKKTKEQEENDKL